MPRRNKLNINEQATPSVPVDNSFVDLVLAFLNQVALLFRQIPDQ